MIFVNFEKCPYCSFLSFLGINLILRLHTPFSASVVSWIKPQQHSVMQLSIVYICYLFLLSVPCLNFVEAIYLKYFVTICAKLKCLLAERNFLTCIVKLLYILLKALDSIKKISKHYCTNHYREF